MFVRGIRREDELQLGAPGQMLIAGEQDEILPANDAKLHRAADPVRDGAIRFDAQANEAREDGIARLLLSRRLSVVVLGGEHDLADNLPKSVEYVRVTLSAYEEAAGERR